MADLARRQHGVFSLAQLVELGLSDSAVRKRAGAQRLHRVYRGVYSVAPTELLSAEGQYMAAVLTCGRGAVLSHHSAARLHGLLQSARTRIAVTVPRRGNGSRPGLHIHRSRTLIPADITTVDGIPCTTVARTLLDLAAGEPSRRLQRAVNQAEVLQVFDGFAIANQLERHPRSSAAAKLRAVLDEYREGEAPTESNLEDRFVELCQERGLPAPERQVHVMLDDGEPPIKVDFLWREHRLILETDGRAFHQTRQAFESDRRRDQRLTLAGWRVVRVSDRQLRDDPRRIAGMVAELLARPR